MSGRVEAGPQEQSGGAVNRSGAEGLADDVELPAVARRKASRSGSDDRDERGNRQEADVESPLGKGTLIFGAGTAWFEK